MMKTVEKSRWDDSVDVERELVRPRFLQPRCAWAARRPNLNLHKHSIPAS